MMVFNGLGRAVERFFFSQPFFFRKSTYLYSDFNLTYMKINLVAFGIAKDILGGREVDYSWEGPATVGGLLHDLGKKYPQLSDLASLKVAINSEYANEEQPITERDEVVLIPPVSGG